MVAPHQMASARCTSNLDAGAARVEVFEVCAELQGACGADSGGEYCGNSGGEYTKVLATPYGKPRR